MRSMNSQVICWTVAFIISTRVFNVQLYTKCAVLKAPCTILDRDVCSLHYVSIKYGSNKTCIIPVPTRQVYVVCAYENQGAFVNIVEARKFCTILNFPLKRPLISTIDYLLEQT